MTAPDVPGRLQALRARGGKLVVVDPRRSKTAEEADEHLPIRPGTDALFLFALVHVLFAEGLVDLGDRRRRMSAESKRSGARRPRSLPRRSRRRAASTRDTIRRIARELAAAPTAAVYGRIGTCTQEFGTLASWLVDVLNVLHRQSRPTRAARCSRRPATVDRRRSHREGARRHVRPSHVAACAGCRSSSASCRSCASPRRSRRRVTARSARSSPSPAIPRSRHRTPTGSGARCRRSTSWSASTSTSTRRHATPNVILPPEPELARGHYDLALYNLAIRNVANYSPPLVELEPGELPEWRSMLRLAGVIGGPGRARRRRRARRLVVSGLVTKAVARARIERRGPRCRRADEGARDAARARSASSTSCCAPVPTATASAPIPTDCRWPSSRPTRTASTSVRCSHASPRCCARRRA